MEEISFWKKFSSPKYLSYFFIFFANIIAWQGSTQTIAVLVTIENFPFFLFIFTISTIIFSIIIGKFIDRSFNRRKFIYLGFALYVLGFAVQFLILSGFTLIERLFDLGLMTIILGIGFGTSTISVGTYFADISHPKERGKLQGLSYCISFAISFVMIIFLTSMVLLVAILSILAICVIIFQAFYTAPPHPEAPKETREHYSYKEIFKHKPFIYFTISFLLFLIALPFIQIFFEFGEPSIEYVSLSFYIYYPLLSIFALIIGFWVDRFGRKPMTLVFFLFLGLGFAIWGIFVPETVAFLLPILIVILVFLSIGNAFANTVDYIIPADYASPYTRGRYLSIFFIATNLGLLISTFLQPYILNLSIATIALIVTCLLLFAITPIILTKDDPLDEALAKEVNVKGIYVISQDGRCLFEMSFKDILIDVDLITSALSAVGSLIRESIHSEKRLKTIDHGDVKILIEYGKNVNAAIISDKETPDIRKRLEDFLMVFERFYAKQLSQWAGDIRPFYGAYKLIEIYFGVYLPQK